MRTVRFPVLTLILSLLLIINLQPISHADDTPTSLVDATITTTYLNATSLHATAQLLIHRIDNIFGQTYTQDQIDHLTNPDDIGAIKIKLREALDAQLHTTLPNAQLTPLGRPTYNPPYFTDDYTINLTTTYFQTPPTTTITTLLPGMLDLGADITYHYTLTSTPGWNTTYQFTLPDNLQLTSATTDHTTPDQRSATWTITNTQGTTPPTDADLTLHATTPTTPPDTPQNLTIDLTLDTRTPTTPALTTTIQIHTLDLTTYPALPAFITHVTTIPADGLRLLTSQGLLDYQTIHNHTIQPLLTRIQPLLETSTLNQTLTFTFTWDPTTTTNCTPPYNTTHMDTQPPLNAQYHDPAIHLTIAGLSARAYFGLINAGANATLTPHDLNLTESLTTLGLPYTITLQLPQNITLDHHNPVTWTPTTTPTGTFHSDVQPNPPYTAERHTTQTTIDVTKLDLNLPTLFTGKTELTASATLTQDDNLYILHTPETIHLPATITLPYLNADAYRLCTEENILPTDTQTTLLSIQRASFETQASTILGSKPIKALTNTKTYRDSLQWNGDIANMDDLTPIILSTYADEATSLSATISFAPAAFNIAPLHFTLPYAPNTTSTYRIILPPGLTLTTVTAPGEQYSTGTTSDNRPYLEFLLNKTGQQQPAAVTCYLTASSLYVLSLFLPLILVIVLLVILIVIILLIRKRRGHHPRAPRSKHTRRKHEDQETTGDEEAEDFYVPPQPPSSKKR